MWDQKSLTRSQSYNKIKKNNYLQTITKVFLNMMSTVFSRISIQPWFPFLPNFFKEQCIFVLQWKHCHWTFSGNTTRMWRLQRRPLSSWAWNLSTGWESWVSIPLSGISGTPDIRSGGNKTKNLGCWGTRWKTAAR